MKYSRRRLSPSISPSFQASRSRTLVEGEKEKKRKRRREEVVYVVRSQSEERAFFTPLLYIPKVLCMNCSQRLLCTVFCTVGISEECVRICHKNVKLYCKEKEESEFVVWILVQ